MAYYIDLYSFSIEKLEREIREMDLIPSWMVLRENLPDTMKSMKTLGIHSLGELQSKLKTKKLLAEFSKRTNVSIEYLTVLRRMINGYHPKAIKIKDFPEISNGLLAFLNAKNISDTKKLYDFVLKEADRRKLADNSGIDLSEINRLAKLTDLVRIRWVNHTFAFVLYKAGYDTINRIVTANHQVLYETIIQLNVEQNLYKRNIGLSDMKQLIYCAKIVPQEMEF